MPLDAATMSALKERALWADPLAHMLAHGWPLTKASYLAVATMAEAPDFPLDSELRSTIPHDSVGVGTTTECLRMGFSDRLDRPHDDWQAVTAGSLKHHLFLSA